MRVGGNLLVQNYADWDRFEAEERGEDVAPRPATPDRAIFLEEVELAVQMDALGFDSVWTIEHHFTPYTMVTNLRSAMRLPRLRPSPAIDHQLLKTGTSTHDDVHLQVRRTAAGRS